jgi:Protein of unknown function (DUF3761)
MNMTKLIGSVALAVGLLAANVGAAQAPAGAPAGATGLCNDGTYFMGKIKTGACTGHKGLKTWYGVTPKTASKPAPTPTSKTATSSSSTPATGSKPATPSTPAATSTPATTPASTPAKSTPAAPTKTSSSTTAQAPGGGPGLVWLNTASNVYHCPGSQYYGKTKAGSYMSEGDAKAKGAHPVGGKPCSK